VGSDAAAEINIFKPDGEKALIKTSNGRPNLTSHCQTSAGRLINLLRLGIVEIEAPIISVQRVRGPETVEEHYFGRHGR
jgi:hypothetical protein